METPMGEIDENGIPLATESNLSVLKKDKKDKKSKKNQKTAQKPIDPEVLEKMRLEREEKQRQEEERRRQEEEERKIREH